MNCDGKIRYPTEAAAAKRARKIRKTAIDPGGISPYQCERHHCWHIGNQRSPAFLRMVRGSR